MVKCLILLVFLSLSFYKPRGMKIENKTHVCQKKDPWGTGLISYCCFNYYYENGVCRACEAGTTSTDGKSCRPCPHNTYGEICKHRCDCSANQRCDKQIGCVSIVSTKTSSVEAIDTTRNQTKGGIPGIERTLAFTKISTDEKTYPYVGSTEATSNYHVQFGRTVSETNTRLVYYLVVAGGLVGWLVFCIAVIRFIYKRIKQKREVTSQKTKLDNQPTRSASITVPEFPTESIYDEIEDVPTPVQEQKRPHSYLSVQEIDEPQKSPVQVKADICIAVNRESIKTYVSTSSDEKLCDAPGSPAFGNGDYLHPYTSLKAEQNQPSYN